MKNNPSTGNRSLRWAIFALIGVVGAAIGFGAITNGWSARAEADATMTFAVAQGPLTISVTESGTIRSRHMEVLSSEVEGQTTILYLIEEGTEVEEGELLVELDSSRLEEQKVDQEIRVQNAEAAYIRSRENLQVVRNQAESDVARARLDLQFAREDLQKYLDGDYPRQLMETQNRITIAEEELERAQDQFEWSKVLHAEQYISKSDLQRDELALKRAQLDKQLAETNLALLENFTHRRQLDQLRSDIEQAEMALERVQLRASSDIIQAEADLRAKEAEFRQQQTRLARTLEQIEKTRIYAPTSGLVIYATTGQGGWRGNAEPLEAGQTVRERQELIHLPTATDVMAEIKVHESSLDKVRSGMPVRVTVDSLPGRVFTGRVARIAPLPDAQSVWMNPDLKVYNTEIHIDGDGSMLRTGMTCRAEIVVEQHREATYVPVQSVLRIGGQPVVYVQNGREIERRPIQLGLDNNRMAHVIDGLSPGERVLVSPPLSEGVFAFDDDPSDEQPVVADTPVAAVSPDERGAEARQGRGEGPRGEGARGEGRRGAQQDGRGEQPGGGPGGLGEMSDEQRQQMRQRFEQMSTEDREAMRQQWQQRQSQQQD